MIKTWAYDIESLPNLFSVVFVDVNDYLKTFEDSCDIIIKKGKEKKIPVPLTQKFTVAEIKSRLDKVNKKQFYITDTDDSQLLPMLGFINSLSPYRDEKGNAVRNDVFGYNSTRYDKLMISALLMYFNTTNTTTELIYKLYETSKHIINTQNDYSTIKHDFVISRLIEFKIPFVNVDIMTIFALNKVGKMTDKNGNEVFYGKSLKQTSINLQWYELLEYELPPIDLKGIHTNNKERDFYKKYQGNLTSDELNRLVNKWDRYILPEYIKDEMHYNTNDVFIVCEMIRLFADEIRLRYNITNVYGVDVLSSSRSNTADKLFIKFYSEFSGLQPIQWRGKKTDRTLMALKKIIFPFITFKTKPLQDFLEDVKKLTLTSIGKDGLYSAVLSAYNAGLLTSFVKDDFAKVYNLILNSKSKKNKKTANELFKGLNVKINNLEYTVATGGLHSKDIPRELRSKLIKINDFFTGKSIWDNLTDDSYIYVHWDISSFYPSIMDVYGIAPAHLNQGIFVKLVKWLKDTRITAKHSTEETIDGIPVEILAEALKIVINSIYGKFGFEKGDLYDRLATLKVTINGQLMILMLCEELELNGIEVFSANTDGIVVKLYKSKKILFDKIANTWKELTKLDADSEEFNCYINRDINNYICQELNGKVTFKGDLNPTAYLSDLSKGYDMPIVAEAVYQFFINDIPVLETLQKCNNILAFCKTQNVNKSFNVKFIKGTGINDIQRNTRFYVSNSGGTIYKVDTDGNYHNLCAKQKVTVLNTLDDKPIELRDICYQYYYNECCKIIDPIKLGINLKQKANPITKTISGKKLLDKHRGQYNSLFDDN